MTIQEFLEGIPATKVAIQNSFITALERVKQEAETDVTTYAEQLATLLIVECVYRAGTQEVNEVNALSITSIVRMWSIPPFFLENFTQFMSMKRDLSIDRDNTTDPFDVELYKAYPQDIDAGVTVESKTNITKNTLIHGTSNDTHKETTVTLDPSKFAEMAGEFERSFSTLVTHCIRMMRKSREWNVDNELIVY